MKPHEKKITNESKSNIKKDKYCINPSGKTLNNKLNKEDIKKLLYLKYGNCIELRSLNDKDPYCLEGRYKFFRNELLYKHTKEFTEVLKNLLYRNYYWINSQYKMNTIYDNIKRDIKKGNFIKNESYYMELHMNDGYDIKWYPDYINLKNKAFLHYFDMSWFSCADVNHTREITEKIFEFFRNNDEWSLDYYYEENYERDFD